MRKAKKSITRTAAFTSIIVLALFLPLTAMAGSLDPSAEPNSTMHTLDEIYNKLTAREITLNELMGQTTRFQDMKDGTVEDMRTGLIWLKNANCFGQAEHSVAGKAVADLADGQCNLSDGSTPGNWRLPNVRELGSIIDYANTHDWGWGCCTRSCDGWDNTFADVQGDEYWTATYARFTGGECGDGMHFVANICNGMVSMNTSDPCCMHPPCPEPRGTRAYVWPVRGGN